MSLLFDLASVHAGSLLTGEPKTELSTVLPLHADLLRCHVMQIDHGTDGFITTHSKTNSIIQRLAISLQYAHYYSGIAH